MTISKLATLEIPSPNRYWGRAYKVTRVTIHHMAVCWSAEQCGESFSYSERQASSNYGIGYDGEIACYVDENDAAWTSSSYDNDNRAITIECSNSAEGAWDGTWAISQATWDSMIALCADICTRYGIEPSYTGDTRGSFTEHMMFAATGCPGPYIHDRMDEIVRQVKEKMAGVDPTPEWPVWMYESNGTTAQKWYPHHNADGTVSLEAVCSPGKFLDVAGAGTTNGTLLQIYPGNGTNAQKLTIAPVSTVAYKRQTMPPLPLRPQTAHKQV